MIAVEKILQFAQEHQDKELGKALVEFDLTTMNESNQTLLHIAAIQGLTDLVRLVAKTEGVNIDQRDMEGQTALYLATLYKNTAVVETLLDAGASADIPDNQGNKPIHIAASNGDQQAVDLLLNHSPDLVNDMTPGLSPLHYAVIALGEDEGDWELIKDMLQRNADIAIIDEMQGRTPREILKQDYDLSTAEHFDQLVGEIQQTHH